MYKNPNVTVSGRADLSNKAKPRLILNAPIPMTDIFYGIQELVSFYTYICISFVTHRIICCGTQNWFFFFYNMKHYQKQIYVEIQLLSSVKNGNNFLYDWSVKKIILSVELCPDPPALLLFS